MVLQYDLHLAENGFSLLGCIPPPVTLMLCTGCTHRGKVPPLVCVTGPHTFKTFSSVSSDFLIFFIDVTL